MPIHVMFGTRAFTGENIRRRRQSCQAYYRGRVELKLNGGDMDMRQYYFLNTKYQTMR